VSLGVLREGTEHIGQEDVCPALRQNIHAKMLGVPVVQSALSNLTVEYSTAQYSGVGGRNVRVARVLMFDSP
jgi:hypothetical protein